jgi:hypothetical protein
MKLRHLWFIVLSAILILPANRLSADPDRLSSQEWSAIPESHKMEFVQMAVYALQDRKVPLKKTPKEYLRDVNDLYAKNPDMAATAISVIVPSLVYKTEPESRKVLDELIKKHEFEILKTI